MAIQIVNSSLSSGAPVVNLGSADSLILGRDGLIVGTNFVNAAILATGSGQYIRIEGSVFGLDGISIGDNAASDAFNNIFIAGTGVIDCTSNGISILARSSVITNYGMIGGSGGIMFISADGTGETVITNAGVMQATNGGIRAALGATQSIRIVNSGELSVGFGANERFAIDLKEGADTVRNTGVISGNIRLGPNADIYDGRGGKFDSTVMGEAGADRLTGGAQAEGFRGGAGRDILAGGGGADAFIYAQATEGRDKITDWQGIDRFEIDASGFGAGLSEGELATSRFRARADNQAQDANDRFIFRTTDRTLWFDANGSAAGGLTLIADLQAGAKVTAADIFLV